MLSLALVRTVNSLTKMVERVVNLALGNTMATQSAVSNGALASTTVIVVDDIQDQLDELVDCLTMPGTIVSGFDSGSAAIDAIYASDDPLVLVADLNMPDISGWGVAETVRRLRERGRSIGFVLVTGNIRHETARRALKLGIDDILEKPVSPDELRQVVAQVAENLRTPDRRASAPSGATPIEQVAHTLLALFNLADRRFPAEVRSEAHLRMILYVLEQNLLGKSPSVSSTCYASGSPVTTALRRLGDLVDAGLVEKSLDPVDKRRASVNATPELTNRFQGLSDLLASEPVGRASRPD